MADTTTVEGCAARLSEVETTIAKAEKQQSYATGLGQSVQRGALDSLYGERTRLRTRLARLRGMGFAVHGGPT